MEAIGEDGSLDTTRTKNLVDVLEGYSYVTDGDVMIAKITPCFENGKGAIAERLRNGLGFATTEVIVVRPDDHADSRFLYYVLSAEPFRLIAEGSMHGPGGQKRVADSFVANYSTGWPSLDEREQIAAFLDHETTKIDRLIARQERLIELLKEKRQAVISHAVRSTSDSELAKLGYFIDLLPGYAFPSASFSHDDSDIPLLRGINVGVDAIRWDETVYWPKDNCAQLHQFVLKPDEFIRIQVKI